MRVEEIKRLVELVEQSRIDELEVRKWWSTVRISRVRRADGQASTQVVEAGAVPGGSSGNPHAMMPMATGASSVPGGGQASVAVPVSAGGQALGTAPAPAAAAPLTLPPDQAPDRKESSEYDQLVPIVSPMVGTFYRAPSPTAPPYIEVGARVKVGQVVCLVEAMKLMNEIESEVAGTIVKTQVENEQPVEFNQPLFLVRPDT